MTKRYPDFQKAAAKNSLWDMDGQHVPHKYRVKGSGRNADKRLILEELQDAAQEAQWSDDERWEREIRESLDCHYYGPCDRCLTRMAERGEGDDD
jgi:hypothetical protein